ncbi:MAG: hypothetical protein AAF471_09555, partial [Myxococcota bacterium]
GSRAKVLLKRGDEIVDEKEIRIPQDHHREEVRFSDVPEVGGVDAYRVELQAANGKLFPGERFDNNNSWEFETAITDARTNVLIVDSHPRWEFRYLRNLFYGRDKSIHLQYVLLEPDTIFGQAPPRVAASAARKFGDAQATELPVSEEEWRKFDVIIIGDVPPDAINDSTWEIIQSCVNDRAALLVAIAGPRHMPHAVSSEVARSLFPVEYTPSRREFFGTDKPPFRLVLTAEGRNHSITAQSDSRLENERVWGEFPEFRWRHPVDGVKEGANQPHGKTLSSIWRGQLRLFRAACARKIPSQVTYVHGALRALATSNALWTTSTCSNSSDTALALATRANTFTHYKQQPRTTASAGSSLQWQKAR